MVQRHAVRFIGRTEASIGSELPGFIKDEFDAISKRPVIGKILSHLGLDLQLPPMGRVREARPHFAA